MAQKHTTRAIALLLLLLVAGGVYWFVIRDRGSTMPEDAPPGVATETPDSKAIEGGAMEGSPGEGEPPAAGPAAGPARFGPPGIPVEGGKPRIGSITREITAVGTLRSAESVMMRPEISGRVTEIHFEEGATVKGGAVLVKLDDSVYRAELEQAKANLALSRRNKERSDELFDRGVITARQRDEADSKFEVDKAALELAKALLEKSVLRAPFSGTLGLRRVSIGDYVSPGQDIVNIEDLDPLKVDFRIPEIFFDAVKVGQAIAIEVDAYPGHSFVGEVYAVDPQIDPQGRSVAVRARVPNAAGNLRPGLFGAVTLIMEERENALIVPEQALIPQGDKHFVYRVIDGKVEMTPVVIGKRRRGEVEIQEGLAEDDTIIISGHMKIFPGAPVTVLPAGGRVQR